MIKYFKNIIFMTLLFLFSFDCFAISNENLSGVWINENFVECVKKENSINKCVQINNTIIAFAINPISIDKYEIIYTSDLHDSGFNKMNHYSKGNLKFLAESEDSDFKFNLDTNNQIIFNGQLFNMLDKGIYTELHTVQDYLTLRLFQGKYIDLISKDTVELIDTNFIINGILKFNYKIGIDFFDSNFDFIEFFFRPGRNFEESALAIVFENDILEFRNILSSKEEGYIKGDKVIYRLLKID